MNEERLINLEIRLLNCIKKSTMKNQVKKEVVNKSSDLSTCLEIWEAKARKQNKIFGSTITKNKFGLITEVVFYVNTFRTTLGYNKKQHIKWEYTTLTDLLE